MDPNGLSDVLQHLRQICAPESDRDLADAELLERFVARREETAFAILVQRHGPMVLSLCQRVLQDTYAAEDAFQATFLVLVRRGADIQQRTSLAGWLYRVAQRIALQARAREAVRRRRDKPAPPPPRTGVLDELTCQELHAVLDEELSCLPERYRVPIVLCYLEGRSYEEAARELGWPKTSLASRITRGRELLRRRLARRRLALSAGVLLAGLAESASGAALSALLAINAVKTAALVAAGETAASAGLSARAITLAEKSMQGFIGVKTVVLAVLLASGVVAGGIGLAGYQALGEKGAAAGQSASQRSAPSDSNQTGAAPQRPAKVPETQTYTGTVVTPDGKPVAQARLFLTEERPARRAGARPRNQQDDPPLRGVTAADGRFEFRVTRPGGRGELQLWPATGITAVAPGYGPGWVRLASGKPTTGITLRLVSAGAPIHGRVLTLEGRPLAGATVRLVGIDDMSEKTLDAVLKASKSNSAALVRNALRLPYLAGFPVGVSIGVDGRFSLPDPGRERIVVVAIEAADSERREIRIIPRASAELTELRKAVAEQRWPSMPRDPGPAVYPPTFDYVARPAKIVFGTVREHGTGKPIAGVTVHGQAADQAAESWWRDQATASTDEKGEYRLLGLPKAKSYRLSIHASNPPRHMASTMDVAGRMAWIPCAWIWWSQQAYR